MRFLRDGKNNEIILNMEPKWDKLRTLKYAYLLLKFFASTYSTEDVLSKLFL